MSSCYAWQCSFSSLSNRPVLFLCIYSLRVAATEVRKWPYVVFDISHVVRSQSTGALVSRATISYMTSNFFEAMRSDESVEQRVTSMRKQEAGPGRDELTWSDLSEGGRAYVRDGVVPRWRRSRLDGQRVRRDKLGTQ